MRLQSLFRLRQALPVLRAHWLCCVRRVRTRTFVDANWRSNRVSKDNAWAGARPRLPVVTIAPEDEAQRHTERTGSQHHQAEVCA